MSEDKLSAVQKLFLKTLFGKAQGDLKKASAELGFDDYSQLMTDEFIDAIKKRADNELMLSVPRAIYIINKMITDEDGGMFVSDKLHKVCADVLDRAGLSRRERASSGSTTIGLVFLPSKNALPEPPTIENQPVKMLLPFENGI